MFNKKNTAASYPIKSRADVDELRRGEDAPRQRLHRPRVVDVPQRSGAQAQDKKPGFKLKTSISVLLSSV